MLGAIIGDIVGSPYEFANTFDCRFPLFGEGCDFTDDTICTVAVADALLSGDDFGSALRRWCLKYPKGCYGGSFSAWLRSANPQPYNSWGNGAAMRVSPCGWAFDSEAETLRAAMASAAPTHNHVEGLIGASVVARAIFRLRTMPNLSFSDDTIAELLVSNYGQGWYHMDNLPPRGVFDVTCQGCVPLAFVICSSALGFEDAIRKAVAYGGDSDTLAAIVGSLAEARWGIPDEIKQKALSMLPNDMRLVINNFLNKFEYGF